jgi:hypothetical protein
VLDGIAYAADPAAAAPDIVQRCTERIRSPFYSVDVVEREDGTLRIGEVGDGQVSDLVGWSVERLVEIWQRRL